IVEKRDAIAERGQELEEREADELAPRPAEPLRAPGVDVDDLPVAAEHEVANRGLVVEVGVSPLGSPEARLLIAELAVPDLERVKLVLEAGHPVASCARPATPLWPRLRRLLAPHAGPPSSGFGASARESL